MLAVYLILGLLVLSAALLLAVRPRKSNPRTAFFLAHRYAHRGLFTPGTDAPENSRAAFRKAVDAGYGIELDVHLSADGHVFVMHDPGLERTTDGQGLLCEQSAEALERVTLRGTEETLPRLEEVLDIIGGRVPLLIELKTDCGNHVALVDAVMAVLQGYDGPCCFESFDPRAVRTLKRYPQAVRGQLSARLSGKGGYLSLPLDILQRNLIFNALSGPDFVSYRYCECPPGLWLCRHVWRVPLFYWTVTDKATLLAAEEKGIACIFEGFDPAE